MNASHENPRQRALSLEAIVRAHADDADRERRLPAVVAEAFAQKGLYRIGAPVSYAGEEADPVTQIETIEAISRFDGSAGWNLMIGIETFGLISPGCDACKQLIEDPMVIMCSSTAAVGKAERENDGYRVTGQWQFVSGCHNSSVFGATVRLYENGEGNPQNLYALITAPDFEIVDTWHVGGMRGSGSHDVKVDGVWVPESHIVAPIGGQVSGHPLMRFPLASRLAYNKVAISLGLCRAAIDAFVDLAEGKTPRFTSRSLRERPVAQRAVAEAEVRLRGSRTLVLALVSEMWNKVVADEPVTLKEKALFQIACSDAVKGAVESVDLLCDAAGTTANFTQHPLERISRDVRVVRQHLTVASHHIEDGGRVLLGLDPAGMMLRGLR
jgi:alkylation response protein AidB-like acyl-CoA dehydrogenase